MSNINVLQINLFDIFPIRWQKSLKGHLLENEVGRSSVFFSLRSVAKRDWKRSLYVVYMGLVHYSF